MTSDRQQHRAEPWTSCDGGFSYQAPCTCGFIASQISLYAAKADLAAHLAESLDQAGTMGEAVAMMKRVLASTGICPICSHKAAEREITKKPRVRAWLQREGEPPHEMTAGFREEDDGRVVFPLALHGEQAILTVQIAERTWRHAIQWMRRKYGEDATDEVWAFYAARIADDLEAQERTEDGR